MSQLQVNTEAMLRAAETFQQLYARAEKAFDEAQEAMPQSKWEGPAAEQANEAYAAFRNKYRDRFLQMLRNYQYFLRENAAEGYRQTEAQNVELTNRIDASMDGPHTGSAGGGGSQAQQGSARPSNTGGGSASASAGTAAPKGIDVQTPQSSAAAKPDGGSASAKPDAGTTGSQTQQGSVKLADLVDESIGVFEEPEAHGFFETVRINATKLALELK